MTWNFNLKLSSNTCWKTYSFCYFHCFFYFGVGHKALFVSCEDLEDAQQLMKGVNAGRTPVTGWFFWVDTFLKLIFSGIFVDFYWVLATFAGVTPNFSVSLATETVTGYVCTHVQNQKYMKPPPRSVMGPLNLHLDFLNFFNWNQFVQRKRCCLIKPMKSHLKSIFCCFRVF